MQAHMHIYIQITILWYFLYIYIGVMQDDEDDTPPILSKDITFSSYSSIEIHTRDKFINSIKAQGYDHPDILWVSSQKIHGSNFSIHLNGTSARYARRTDFFSEEIPIPCHTSLDPYFKQSFHNAKDLVTRFHNNLPQLFSRAQKLCPTLLRMIVYGEYFGGSWPEPTDYKPVQKGVYYSPCHEFFAFDVYLICIEKSLFLQALKIEPLLQNIIPCVPTYAKGTFQEMINIDSKIDSTIPVLLKYKHLENNIIEGFVIRPNQDRRLKNGKRVMIKKKNGEFSEKISAPSVKKEGKKKIIHPEVEQCLEGILTYVNVNRIDSVVSKYPDQKDRRALCNEVVKDVISEAKKDQMKMPREELIKEFNDQLSKAIMKEINAYFVKH